MEFNLKTLVLAVGMTLIATTSAQAATSKLDFANDNNTTAIFGDLFTTSGAFTDHFTFTINAGDTGTLNASVLGLFDAVFGNTVYGVEITGFSLSGTSSATGTLVSGGPADAGTLFSQNADYWTLASTLGAGTYSIDVTGSAKIKTVQSLVIPTSYGGKAVLEITSVPEPESYSMMLAGLGLMGFVATRRKLG